MQPPKNLRDHLNFNKGYETICREERNLAAILYHLLLDPKNLTRFLILVVLLLVVSAESGAFAPDTHYYLTFGMALATCFDWDEAHADVPELDLDAAIERIEADPAYASALSSADSRRLPTGHQYQAGTLQTYRGGDR